jgi:rod shape-determining protein MreC
VLLAPAAGIDGVRHVLVLEPLSAQLPPMPELSASAPKAGHKAGAKAAKASGVAP